jgi:hypothetical protein
MNKEVFYKGTITRVLLGDKVALRTWSSLWLRKEVGVVTYVPGLSPHNKSMHYNGISEVCVTPILGGAIGLGIDPHSGQLWNSVTLLERGDLDEKCISPDQDPFESENSA